MKKGQERKSLAFSATENLLGKYSKDRDAMIVGFVVDNLRAGKKLTKSLGEFLEEKFRAVPEFAYDDFESRSFYWLSRVPPPIVSADVCETIKFCWELNREKDIHFGGLKMSDSKHSSTLADVISTDWSFKGDSNCDSLRTNGIYGTERQSSGLTRYILFSENGICQIESTTAIPTKVMKWIKPNKLSFCGTYEVSGKQVSAVLTMKGDNYVEESTMLLNARLTSNGLIVTKEGDSTTPVKESFQFYAIH